MKSAYGPVLRARKVVHLAVVKEGRNMRWGWGEKGEKRHWRGLHERGRQYMIRWYVLLL